MPFARTPPELEPPVVCFERPFAEVDDRWDDGNWETSGEGGTLLPLANECGA